MDEFRNIRGPIAMITGTYPSLSMTFVDREVRAFRAMGAEVRTFTLRPPAMDRVASRFQVAEARRAVPLFRLACNPGILIAAWLAALMHPLRLGSTICLAAATGLPGGPGPVRQMAYLCAAVVLARQVRRQGVLHIHNHLGDSSGTVAMLAAELSGLPFSMTLHGPEIFEEAGRWYLRRKIARAAFVACISKFGRARAMLSAEPEDWPKLKIVRCGVELARYPKSDRRTDGRRLLFVGRLEPRKGLATLLEAMSLLRKRRHQAHLTLVGQGSLRQAIESRIEMCGLGEDVTLAGPMDETGVARTLGRADMLIVPSLAEGLPVVIMEAMACGLPVIASAVDGIPELVLDGVTGLLVPPADADALSDAIERLSSDPDLRARLGRAGRDRVRRDHDAAKNARELLELIAAQCRDPARSFRAAHPRYALAAPRQSLEHTGRGHST